MLRYAITRLGSAMSASGEQRGCLDSDDKAEADGAIASHAQPRQGFVVKSGGMPPSKCVRGREYHIRVDLKKTDINLGPEIANGGHSVVYRATVDGQVAVVKKPHLPTKCAREAAFYCAEQIAWNRFLGSRIDAANVLTGRT